MNWQTFANPFVVAQLRSPLHGWMGPYMAAITLHGRKSGKRITLPINVLPMGEALVTISFKQRKWWRNLRGGAPVTLRWKGHDHAATASVIEEDSGVGEVLVDRAVALPSLARYYEIAFDAAGRPDPASVARAAAARVAIKICFE